MHHTNRVLMWVLGGIFGGMVLPCAAAQAFAAHSTTEQLPALPDPVVGHAAAVVNGLPLMVGGVTAWPEGVLPADALRAGVWQLQIAGTGYSDSDTQWHRAGDLPAPVAFAASVTAGNRVFLAGGIAPDGVTRDVWRLTVSGGSLTIEPLPPLPRPRAFAAAGVIGDTLYVFGGLAAVSAEAPTQDGWQLELTDPDAKWTAMPALPQPVAVPPVSGSDGASILAFDGPGIRGDTPVFGGRAYRFQPGTGWAAIAPPPVPVRGGSASVLGQNHMLVLGDTGESGPGGEAVGTFFKYHAITDTWTSYRGVDTGDTFVAQRGAKLVPWNEGVLVAGGLPDRPLYWYRHIEPLRPRFGLFDYVTLVGYFSILIAMGVYISRKESSTDAYFLGNRKLPWWAVGISIFGTSLSSITYLTIPASSYAGDWVLFLSNVGIVLVAPVVVAWYVPRFRASGFTTAYEFLEERFNYPVRLYGSLTFLFFQIARIGIVMFLPAIALSTATGISIYVCVLAMGVIATIYTVLGGIEAVIWTDVIQAVVLIAGALLTLAIIALNVEGGLPAVVSEGQSAGKFHMINWTWDTTTTALWVCLVGNFFLQLYPRTADQAMVQRYFTTPTTRDAQRAVWVDAALTIPVSILFFGMGTALWVFYRHHPEMLHPELQNDAIVPLFVVQHFPTGLAGILIAGVFAASMSTLDSSLNSMASVLVTDFYRRWKRDVNDRAALILARWITVGLGAFGTAAALIVVQLNVGSMFEAWLRVVGLLGGGLSGVFALGIFTRRASGAGALCGVAASASAVYALMRFTHTHHFLYPVVAFTMAVGVGYAVSLVVPGKAVSAAAS